MSKSDPHTNKFLVYQGEDGNVRVDVRLQNETLWLSLKQLAELFGVDKSGISRHLKNIFESGELKKDSVVAVFATTASDEKTYQVEHFNLDAIISVGCRVNTMTGREILIHAGEISNEQALYKAHDEYDIFRQKQLEEPTEVEKNFIDAEKKLKQIEAKKRKKGTGK